MKKTIYINGNHEINKKANTIELIKDEQKFSYPVQDIDKIVQFGNFKVSSELLFLCAKLKIPIFFCNFYGRYKGMFLPPESNVGKIRLYQYKTILENNKKAYIAQQILSAASYNKITIIKRYNKEGIKESINRIKTHLKNISKVYEVNSLRGLEGNIQDEYFTNFNQIFKKYIFNQRTRQPPQDEINCMLSFGNMLLYFDVLNQIYYTSLDPFLGIIHEMQHNKPTLALDIAEMFKQPMVDSIVLDLVNHNEIQDKHFDKTKTACFLNQHGRKIFCRKYEEKLKHTFKHKILKDYVSYRQCIRLELYKLIKYFTGEKGEYTGFRSY